MLGFPGGLSAKESAWSLGETGLIRSQRQIPPAQSNEAREPQLLNPMLHNKRSRSSEQPAQHNEE